ncbi:MAG: tRNA (adenine-N1)-methyltransferase [Anaerolineae bacterium]|nr:tRNA (adenine-N1)-methyltransferase [Anaerolineae bacterium]
MDVAHEGDLVLLFSKDYKQYVIALRAGARMQTHRGIVAHDDLIGQPLGRQVRTHLGHVLLVLEPSTGDLIRRVKRVTQIMYAKDIGYVLLRLNIRPGARVIEAGTGSGGLTIALARTVQPSGHVYSYEHQPEIQGVAQENVRALGLGEYVTFRLRDIADGFEEHEVDALFLDVRDPWSYLAQAHAALKGGGFFGAIVPSTNQVAHLLNDLQRSAFSVLEVEELILRPYKAVPARLRPMDRIVGHTGYLVFARKVVGELDGDWFTPSRGRARAAERGAQDDYW